MATVDKVELRILPGSDDKHKISVGFSIGFGEWDVRRSFRISVTLWGVDWPGEDGGEALPEVNERGEDSASISHLYTFRFGFAAPDQAKASAYVTHTPQAAGPWSLPQPLFAFWPFSGKRAADRRPLSAPDSVSVDQSPESLGYQPGYILRPERDEIVAKVKVHRVIPISLDGTQKVVLPVSSRYSGITVLTL